MALPTTSGDYAYIGVGGKYTGSNPKAQLYYNYGVPTATLDAYFGSGGATGGGDLTALATMLKGGGGTTPGSAGIPSGNAITSGATSAARGYANELAALSKQYNLGRGLFTGPGYDAPSWSDPAFRKEAATRRQYYADITNPMIRDLAGQVSRAGAMRGGYGVRGAGGPADAMLGFYKAIAANAADRQQQIYQDITGEREATRTAAMRGFEDLLGGRQGAYSGYTAAAGSQAQAAAADRANQLAAARLALDYMTQARSTGMLTPEERRMADPYGYAHKAALQAAMDQEQMRNILMAYAGGYQPESWTGVNYGGGGNLPFDLMTSYYKWRQPYGIEWKSGNATPKPVAGQQQPTQQFYGYGGQNIPQMYNPWGW